ncbi:Fic family protein [Hungatella effluvii]|uniref:Fic family protein n=1 Tax=Hungatella effluvii TaxID=1096246 RepID=UPI0022E7F66F|nr:Fic family protein [Hungatella effluvii]
MDYELLLRKKRRYQLGKDKIPQLTSASYEQAFEIEYTHNSTAIEGNTLTLMETKLVLEDGISVGGKNLREIYEQINHQKAFRYVKECIANHVGLEEKIVKDIHAMLMENILVGGVYRNVDVYISGAQHTPPSPNEMYRQVKNFYGDLLWKRDQLNSIELAAWTHAEFVRIHPFPDGNGRTSRLIMNYQLMAQGFPPISIAKENRLLYFNTLEAYAMEGNLSLFAEMIADLEEQQLDRYIGMIIQGEELDQGYQDQGQIL